MGGGHPDEVSVASVESPSSAAQPRSTAHVRSRVYLEQLTGSFACYVLGGYGTDLLVLGQSDRGRTSPANAVSRSTMLELPGDIDHLSERPGSVAGQPDGNEEAIPQRITLLAERLADGEDGDVHDDDP